VTSIQSHFADYAAFHATRGNKMCHRFGIPMIVFSLFGLLSSIDLPFDPALVLIALSAIYYLALSRILGVVMLIVTLGFWFFARELALIPLWTIFIGGWILQGIGHSVYEKKQPAFLRNLVHLLIGPLWIANDVLPSSVRVQPGGSPAASSS